MAEPVGIVGLGHIGGSLAKSLLASGDPVVGWTRTPATLAAAAAEGVEPASSVAQVVARAQIVVLASPLAALPATLDEVGRALTGRDDPPTVTDVGSVKVPIVAHAARALPDPSVFVPGHPLAGTERTGWAHAHPGLFAGTTWALVPDTPTDPARCDAVAVLVDRVGATPVAVGADRHDAILALTSHLPYVLAAVLSTAVGATDDPDLTRRLSGGSLDGATRVARAGSALGPDMVWANREAVSARVGDLVDSLQALRAAIDGGDREAVDELFASASAVWPEGARATEGPS